MNEKNNEAVNLNIDLNKPSTALNKALIKDRYLDRELSWLSFNQRVLELAEDENMPVLERANFLAIFASNLDEFFMVRVAGLKRRIITGLAVPTNVGKQPHDLLIEITRKAHELQIRHAKAYQELVNPALSDAGIHIVTWNELDAADKEIMAEYYHNQIYPILMPLAVDSAHPFPYISGLSLNLAVRIWNPKTGKEEFARVKVPQMMPRLIRVDKREDENYMRFISIEDLIAHHLDNLFPGMEVIEHHVFRVTRNEDVEVEEDEMEDLIQALEKELVRRRFGPPIRLEVSAEMDDATKNILIGEFDITNQEVYALPGPLDLRALFSITNIDRPELHYPKHVPVTPLSFQPSKSGKKPDFFKAISKKDILVHHPYESFTTTVQGFIEQAAADPNVLAIKQTLYRTSGDSPIVAALIKAAESGKQVLALVEVKARFDEEANITWARKLEKAGVHVVYGLVGLKTHCKLIHVIRRENNTLKHYSHIGTGNYNPKTSRIYEDLGIFTASEVLGKDMTKLFNVLSGYAIEKKYKRMLVAPLHMRNGLIERIHREAENAKLGKKAKIQIKLNSIVDEVIIDALYRASQAGVQIEVWVRGICSIKAGVTGLSENIKIRSILGRYLEHSRVYAFHNDNDPEVFIGSADMMHRNLDRRIEALVKLQEPEHIGQVLELLNTGFHSEIDCWEMQTDGVWLRNNKNNKPTEYKNIQEMNMSKAISRRRKQSR